MKAVLCGTGWRAMFYLRISRMVPELLSIVSVYTRREERAEMMKKEGVASFLDINKALAVPHDAVIVASGKEGFFQIMKMLDEMNEFVIAETSFLSLPENELCGLSGMKGAVAEQYRYTPLFSSMIASLDMLGDVDQLYLSGLHNHHSASIARIVLNLGAAMPDEISSVDFPSRILKTGGRNGLDVSGADEYTRKLRILRFGKKLFIHDFSSNQYHSYLFGKKAEIRGSLGIMTEHDVNMVADGYPVSLPFSFHRDYVTGNGSLTLSHVTVGRHTVFVNPFYPRLLNDDEIAIAILIKRIENGEDYPSILSGIEDARLGRLL